MPFKHWTLRQSDPELAASLSQRMNISKVLASVLIGRGCDTPEKIQSMLGENEIFSDPLSMRDMDKACERVRRAIENGESVAIYGDYDCDGIMATVILYRYLESSGCDVGYYIPERDSEGYGLNKKALKAIYDSGISLVITVDNGVAAIEEIEYAAQIGLDIVVTDHHKPRESLPDAVAVVDPHRADDESGCEYLAGAGVAFKLACALEGEDSAGFLLEQFGDLLAAATVADIVPLTGENREFVRRGLALLTQANNPGLAALMRVCGLDKKKLTSESLAFGLAPRINSAGRFNSVDDAVRLFTTEDENELEQLAAKINSLNDQRRGAEDVIVKQIFEQLQNEQKIIGRRVIVLHGENWRHGVVGIVAARMVERFGKPCIVLSTDGQSARGSGRSVEGFSIIDAICACSKYLTRYGGHNQAAGITLPLQNVQPFTQAINEWAAEHFAEMPQQRLTIDCEISPRDLEISRIEPLHRLEPFGCANETPVFVVRSCTVQGVYPISDGRHIRLRLHGGDTVFYAVYFGVSPQEFPYATGEKVDVALTAEVDEWQGEKRVSVKIRDIHLAGVDYEALYHSDQLYQRLVRSERLRKPELELIKPSRDDIAVVYRYVRAKKKLAVPPEILYARLSKNISALCKLKVAVDVLDEMKLIRRSGGRSGESITLIENPARVDINNSKILQSLREL